MNNAIFFYLYNLGQDNNFLGKLALFVSYKLIYIVLFFVLFWIIFFAKNKMYHFSLFTMTLFSAWLLSRIIKHILSIPRPYQFFNIEPLYLESGFSFPSEHMSVFMSLGLIAYFVHKKVGILFIVFALVVGFTRIVVGVHYPVDILASTVLALLISNFYINLFKKI